MLSLELLTTYLEALKIIGISNSADNRVFNEMVLRVLKKSGLEISKRHVQNCHHLKEKEKIIAKFVTGNIVSKPIG